MTNLVPAFEVEPIEGKVTRQKIVYEERDTGKKDKYGNPITTHQRKVEEVEEPAGYMVYFARGHSIRVQSDEELARLGLDGSPHMTDASGELTDEDVSRASGNVSLKRRSQAEARRGKKGRAASSDVDQLANPEGE